MRCIVCQADAARYRCRHCRSAYCSATCFKVHRTELPITTMEASGTVAGGEEASLPTNLSGTTVTVVGGGGGALASNCFAIMAAQAPAKARKEEEALAKALQDPFSDAAYAASVSTAGAAASRKPGEPPLSSGGSGLSEPASAPVMKRLRADGMDGSEGSELAPEGDGPSALKVARTEAEGSGSGREGFDKDADVTAVAPPSPPPPLQHPQPKAGDEEEGLTILSEKHLRSLANTRSIRNALKDTSLQRLLKTIDSSRSRLDALEAALFNNPDFKAFCAEVKAAIALAELSDR